MSTKSHLAFFIMLCCPILGSCGSDSGDDNPPPETILERAAIASENIESTMWNVQQMSCKCLDEVRGNAACEEDVYRSIFTSMWEDTHFTECDQQVYEHFKAELNRYFWCIENGMDRGADAVLRLNCSQYQKHMEEDGSIYTNLSTECEADVQTDVVEISNWIGREGLDDCVGEFFSE